MSPPGARAVPQASAYAASAAPDQPLASSAHDNLTRTAARSAQALHAASVPMGSSGTRSQRPPMPSPLSATSNASSGSSSPSLRPADFPAQSPSNHHHPVKHLPINADHDASHQTTFYSDSSNSPSPEPDSPRPPDRPPDRLDSVTPTSDALGVSEPQSNRPAPRAPTSSPKAPMAGPVVAALGQASKASPRHASIDSSISAMPSPSQAKRPSHDGQSPADIAHLIKTAGSPEAVIQRLLKEKHSQSQQNSQLWRLVDKQRAMVLGLNQDLERALKDKEKYRTKLREIVEGAVPNSAHLTSDRGREAATTRCNSVPSLNQFAHPADSGQLDSSSPSLSPVDASQRSFPITPPADRPSRAPVADADAVSPKTTMPKSPESFYSDQDCEDAGSVRMATGGQELGDALNPSSLPPSRNLPSEPPTMPPPQPPNKSMPKVNVVEATPLPDAGLAQFPAPPPRKSPPSPLQLRQPRAKPLAPALRVEDEDSESDYDDILEVDEILPEKRGRRRTREEDDRRREIAAMQEAQTWRAPKHSNATASATLGDQPLSRFQKEAVSVKPQHPNASLGTAVNDSHLREIPRPPTSSGLPASPRPIAQQLYSSPLSPHTIASFPAAPLSPRPPHQALPFNPSSGSLGGAAANSKQDATSPVHAGSRLPKPAPRTGIYKGFRTDEYPDLLLPPNALPSVEIKVASSRMKPSRASLMSLTQLEENPVFTLAILSRSDHGELWRVEKDSASLAKLDQRLKQCAAFTAKTPDRSLFSGHAPAKLDARRFVLETYLSELLDTPLDAGTALELCKYLSTNTLPPNSDETGSSSGAGADEPGRHKIGPEGRPLRNGYLTKRGKNFGGWKARFFVLDGPVLRYFETPGGAHLGSIKLQNAQIGKQTQSGEDHPSPQAPSMEDLNDQYRHAFLILEPKKKDSSSHVKHVLCAESDQERDSWVAALLQWIDYRDSADDKSSWRAPLDQHPFVGQENQAGGKSKKGGLATAPAQQPEADALFGVRYDATQAGEAPQGAPGRQQTASGVPESHSSSSQFATDLLSAQSSRLISSPKDGQVIADSAAWGKKTAALNVSNDEKKQRKRSFFGFGPKARSSLEDQSTSGSIESGSTSTSAAQQAYQGSGRQVFGLPLAEAVHFCAPFDVRVPLPSVVYRCVQFLDAKNAITEEGIFRLSGSNVVIRQLRERFNVEGDVNLVTDDEYHDIHAVASLLKLYLRELPTTILTRDLHLEFLAAAEIADRGEKMRSLNKLAQRLPLANATLLRYLISFLIRIIKNADKNKMTVRNVGIVFSPTLNIPAPVFALFLQNYEAIFGTDPDGYELPCQSAEPGDRQPAEPSPRADMAVRLSTSSGSASPQRPPRVESRMRDHQPSSPTTPLAGSSNAVWSSPTPPLATSREGHDSPSSTDSWPSYETRQRASSAGASAGQDVQTYHVPAGRPGNSAAASRAWGTDAGGEDGHDGPANRRGESNRVYMSGGVKGLQQQGSRSRLREETRL